MRDGRIVRPPEKIFFLAKLAVLVAHTIACCCAGKSTWALLLVVPYLRTSTMLTPGRRQRHRVVTAQHSRAITTEDSGNLQAIMTVVLQNVINASPYRLLVLALRRSRTPSSPTWILFQMWGSLKRTPYVFPRNRKQHQVLLPQSKSALAYRKLQSTKLPNLTLE
jgi:hypothetical protein